MGVGKSLRRHTRPAVSAALALAALVALQVSPSEAGQALIVAGPTVVSPDGATGGPGGTGIVNWPVCDSGANEAVQRWESEPSLAVSAVNPDQLATAWIQGNDDGIVVGYSSDGGTTWGHVVPPTIACTGGTQYQSALDPWVSFGPPSSLAPDGVAYLSSLVSSAMPPGSAVIVNRSLDAGQTWLPPVTLDDASDSCLLECTEELDNSNVAADPYHAGFAYAAWARFKSGSSGFTGHEYVAHTEDGGATWSEPSVIPWSSGEDQIQGSGRLLVLNPTAGNPNGQLVDVFIAVPPFTGEEMPSGPTTLMASRSSDSGVHWSTPIPIALADSTTTPAPGVALAPDGKTIYVAWEKPELTGCPVASRPCFGLMLAKSPDGGVSWDEPSRIGDLIPGLPLSANGPKVLGAPSVAVADDGTVGVAFYDQRNDPTDQQWDPSNPTRFTVTTDYWLRHSHDGGKTWKEDHLFGPFPQDIRKAKGESRFKDYQGITRVAGGLAIDFTAGTTGDPIGGQPTSPPSDILFMGIKIRPPAADLSIMKTDSPDPVHVGKRLTYTITASNGGPDTASGVRVSDVIPSSTRFLSASASQGSCTRMTQVVTCNLGDLNASQAATVTIIVKPTAKGSITNVAAVSASSPADPNSANNTATAATTVKP